MTTKAPLLLAPSLWAREHIWQQIFEAFTQADLLAQHNGAQTSVWSAAEVFLGARKNLDVMRGIFEIQWASPVLRLSLALRLGEVRIGLIVPRYTGFVLETLHTDEAYPTGGRGCARVVRALGKQFVLFDYVFSGQRLGDDDLTRRALSADTAAMSVLADALYFEARHLREGLVHRLHASGVVLQEVERASGLELHESSDLPLELETHLDAQELRMLTGLPMESVVPIGASRAGLSRFVLLVPEDRTAELFGVLANHNDLLAA